MTSRSAVYLDQVLPQLDCHLWKKQGPVCLQVLMLYHWVDGRFDGTVGEKERKKGGGGIWDGPL